MRCCRWTRHDTIADTRRTSSHAARKAARIAVLGWNGASRRRGVRRLCRRRHPRAWRIRHRVPGAHRRRPESRCGAEGSRRSSSRRRPNRQASKRIRVRASTRPSARHRRLPARPRLADHGAGRGRHRDGADRTAGSAAGARPDRRCARLHPSARNRALRCEADEHSCVAGLLPRRADRLRCRARGRRDRRVACDAHRGVAAVCGTRTASRQAAVGADRSVRAGVHGRRAPDRQAAVFSRDVDGTGRRASQQAGTQLLEARSPGCHAFSTRGCTGRWRRSRTAVTTRARN